MSGSLAECHDDPAVWRRQRYKWLEGVRQDGQLSDKAKLIAVALVFDIACQHTMNCEAKLSDIRDIVGGGDRTIQRALCALEERAWLVIDRQVGRGLKTRFYFLRRASVLPFQNAANGCEQEGKNPVNLAPFSQIKPCQFDTISDVNGVICDRNGAKSAGFYSGGSNIDNPKKTLTRAPTRGGARERLSQNPVVIAEAQRLVQRLRDGRADALDDAPVWVLNHILAAGLLTEAECLAAGLSQAEKED